MGTLRVGLLGSLTIEVGSLRTGLPSSTQRRLLSILALEAGHLLPADRLCDLLECTTGSLRTSVSRLRSGPVGGHLSTAPPGYQLDATTDAAEFEALVAAAGLERGVRKVDLLDAALALWRGEAVEEFRSEPWALPEVARLDELRSSAIEGRADALVADGDVDRAIAELGPHIARRPLRERPRATLMQALARSGRSTEALRVFQDFRRYLGEETGTEPSEQLRTLEREIAGGSGVERARDTSPPSTLPAQRTTLIGREELVDRVRELIGEHRLVTLIGPGGVGKTRLAIESADRSLGAFPGGVFFADLTRATSPDDVVGVVVGAMKAPVRAGQSEGEAAADFLEGRRALLVVDNCEHVVERSADLIDDLLVAAPTLRVLATSRESLRLHGERRLIVPSLDVDGPDSSGARLFVDRARAVDEAAAGRAEALDRVVAAEIAARLDGIPLAIELAAARTATHAPAEILALLDDRFELLTARLRRVPLRHQTLTATVEWSYDLLEADEQRAFRLLATCAGAFTPATATGVLATTPAEAARLVEALRAKSLVVLAPDGDEPVGHDYLETLREYGRAKAELADEVDAAADALEHVLMPSDQVRGDWPSFVNHYLCAADPVTMIESTTRLAAATRALDGGRLDRAALLFASVAYRDDVGALRARAALVAPLTERRDELEPTAWLAAQASKLLLDRGARDYGKVMETAATVLEALPTGHAARGWFEVWQCALTTAVAPEAGIAATDIALRSARRHARPPLDWTVSQFLATKASGLAFLRRLDEADDVAAEAIGWAPPGQESRDQVLALQMWIGYLRGVPIGDDLARAVAGQGQALGLAELCAAPAILAGGGPARDRARRLVVSARRRPKLDIPTPYLLAFAWLAIEEGEVERAKSLVACAELYDSSTALGLLHALAAIGGWTEADWPLGHQTMVGTYLGPDHDALARQGAATLDEEVERWERLLADLGPGDHRG